MKNGLIIDQDGTKRWYQDDQLHRLDGPAAEYANGYKVWYQHDQLHRLDGPAIESANGDKRWYQDDRRHRLDGPAVEYANGTKFWFYRGKEIYCSSQQEFEKLLKLKAFW